MFWLSFLGLSAAATLREDVLNLVEPKYTVTTHFGGGKFEPDPEQSPLPIQFRGQSFTCYLPWPPVKAENDTERIVKGQLNSEVAYFLTSSLEGQSLVMDRGEWWTYELKVGKFLRQVHFDRPGMVKKANDPTPYDIILGRWEVTRREYPDQLFPIDSFPQEISVFRYVLRFSHPQKTKFKYGFILDWMLKVGNSMLNLHYKVDDYTFLLKEPVLQPLFRQPYKTVERKEPVLHNATQLFYKQYYVCQDCRFAGILSTNDTLILKTPEVGPISTLVVHVWDDKLIELDQEVTGKTVDSISVLDSMGGRFRYKEFRHNLNVIGRVVIGQGTNFGGDIGKSILFAPINTVEKSHFSRRESAPLALLEVQEIVSPSVLLLSRSLSEYRQLSTPSLGHYYSVHELTNYTEMPSIECPSTVSLGSPLWLQRFDSECLRVANSDSFLLTFGVLFAYVGRPSFHGFTIELFSGSELAAFYLLGWKNNTDNTFTITGRPGDKQAYGRGFFDDQFSSLYLAYRNHTLFLGKGEKIGDLIKFKSKFTAKVTKIVFKASFTLIVKNIKIREITEEVDRALLFAKSLPSVVDKATFTEELTGGATCELTQLPREASVLYTCGSDDLTYLKSVNEYSTCKYTAVVSTPVLCPASDSANTDEIENIDCVLSP